MTVLDHTTLIARQTLSAAHRAERLVAALMPSPELDTVDVSAPNRIDTQLGLTSTALDRLHAALTNIEHVIGLDTREAVIPITARGPAWPTDAEADGYATGGVVSPR